MHKRKPGVPGAGRRKNPEFPSHPIGGAGRAFATRGLLLAGRLTLLLSGFLALAGSLSSCTPRQSHERAGQKPLIGFSLDSLVVERWRRDLEVLGSSVRELGGDFVYRVADQDAEVQKRQVRELADLGIDVLVIVPNDADRLSDVISELRGRGLAVLSYDRLVRRAGVNLYVSFDNEKVGALMAESALAASPGGDWLILDGARNDNNALLLNRGIHSVLDPSIAAGRITIAGETWPASWDSEDARRTVESALAGGTRFSAVVAGNDMLAEAAIAVLAEYGLAGKVTVVGQDADLAACQRIAEGSQEATVYKPIEALARRAAECAVALARKQVIIANSTIDDGRGKVPFISLEPILVTADNLDSTVIRDGFHSAGEVYRNVRK
ncbi:MAG: substrate-binding domain-containing protein [Rectinemataceae bacterium]